MHTRSSRLVLASVAVALALIFAAGCSDDENTTTASPDGFVDNSSTAPPSEFQVAAEERGKPEMESTGPVDELVITDEVEGTGAEVEPGDSVTAHYVGVVASSGEEFDSSWEGGSPATFSLDEVIPGWSEGLVGMKEGGRRTLVIPAAMAYGDVSPPGSGIPPGADLIFTVDMVEVT